MTPLLLKSRNVVGDVDTLFTPLALSQWLMNFELTDVTENFGGRAGASTLRPEVTSSWGMFGGIVF
jgi:hypothetical protein